MKNGMIVELPSLGRTQVIGEVIKGDLKDIWGLGLIDSHSTLMSHQISDKLEKEVRKACRKEELKTKYEEAKDMYLTHAERLDCIK